MNGLYVHFPFCLKKCGYCDFYSVLFSSEAVRAYITALSREIGLRAGFFGNGQAAVSTIFFGGGTPSLLGPDQIRHILDRIKETFAVTADAEITLEANPGTLNAEGLRRLRQAGVNRLSIGVQSLHAEELSQLTRMHTADRALSCFYEAGDAGFTNIGIDLIYGLPGQKLSFWETTLERAAALGPKHISAYSLTWSDSTPLGRAIRKGALPRPDDDTAADMFLLADRLLTAAGYEHYEVSNFARPGYCCRHNKGYWNGASYLGLGPAAHSYHAAVRSWNISDLQHYNNVLSQHLLPEEGSETLTEDQQRLETIALELRTGTGTDLSAPGISRKLVTRLCREKKARRENGRLVLTAQGLLLADEIALMLS